MSVNIVECASCHEPCGKEYPATVTDPQFREGIGENFISSKGEWCCSQFCMDADNGVYDDE